MENNYEMKIGRGSSEKLGAVRVKGGINFAVGIPDGREASLILADAREKKEVCRIELPLSEREGDVASCFAAASGSFKYAYWYEIEGEKYLDPYAGRIADGVCYVDTARFDWKDDKAPRIPMNELLIYKLHVRGFTMDSKSKVRDKGTFRGLVHKIPYIKDLGFNAVELMPAYEWDDTLRIPHLYEAKSAAPEDQPRNYWGYAKKNYYFSPKAALAPGRDAASEFRMLVRTLHENGIECIMEFYVPEGEDPLYVDAAVRHWISEYHVDGFHFLGAGVPKDILAKDPYLAGAKLFFDYIDVWRLYGSGHPARKRLIEYNGWFQNISRRFLRGDDWIVADLMNGIRRNPVHNGVVNYIANTDGFTLYDAVSYDAKHNEKNGEDNQDGSNENFSWNCGVEGATRKKEVIALRKQQVKNALSYVFLSQGIPLLYAGDEFGNTQSGNNNAYALDDPQGWVSWGRAAANRDITDFLKELIAFRKAHPILHAAKELRGFDAKALGCPDISFHGSAAFLPETGEKPKAVGICLNGGYAALPGGDPDDYIMLLMNGGFEAFSFALPVLPKGLRWTTEFTTDEAGFAALHPGEEGAVLPNLKMTNVPAHSVTVLVGRKMNGENELSGAPENDNEAS